jgi:transcriptional regulator
VNDLSRLHRFMREHSFGMLISIRDGAPFVSHVPLLMDESRGPNGSVVGHVARANPQWQGIDGEKVLAVFSGPHAYVSPSFYEAENVVPTWNYVAVHAYGTIRVIEDLESLTEILQQSVKTYEQSRENPWKLDISTPFFDKMVRAIVGFRIEIDRLEGKWKLSQNHPPERQAKVRHALTRSSTPDDLAIARLMAEIE